MLQVVKGEAERANGHSDLVKKDICKTKITTGEARGDLTDLVSQPMNHHSHSLINAADFPHNG